MRKLLAITLLSFTLVACNSAFNEYKDEADQAFLDGDFPNALTNYELAMDEKPDNEEVLGKIDLLEDYFYLLDLVEEAKWEEADEIAENILNDDYIEDSLIEEIEALQVTINEGLENDENVTTAMDKITKLLDKEDLKAATKKIKQLNEEYDVTNFSKELKDLDKDVKKTKEIIAEKERKKKRRRGT